MQIIRLIRKVIQSIGDILFLFITVFKSVIKGNLSRNKIKRMNDVVLVVGNGPSASTIDLNEVRKKGVELFCVNGFACKSSKFFDLKPKYYCLIDPVYYTKNSVYYAYSNDIEETLKCLKKVDWPMYFICKNGQELPFENKYIKTIKLPNITYDWNRYAKYLYRNNMANFGFQNVIGACLFFCITARMKRVFLVGVENDWHRDAVVGIDNNVYLKKNHFYDNKTINATEAKIIKKGELYKYFEWYAENLRYYKEASMYASYMKVPIYNLTEKSYIDVFDKKSVVW